jgi:hypothetical protein
MDAAPAKDPNLPPLIKIGDLIAPKAPQDVASARLDDGFLSDLALKLAYTVARFTTDWVAKTLHLSLPLVQELLPMMCRDGIIEETMQTGQGISHYKITQRGREHAGRLMEVGAYIGPAPVRLEAYGAFLRWQFTHSAPVLPEHVTSALTGLVIEPEAAQLAGLAVSAGRSLFVYGPSGNGKSSLGRQIAGALQGDVWIPYSIGVGNSIIRLFDDQCHQRVEVANERGSIDRRWVRIRRPLVIVGGELTIEYLDPIYSPRCATTRRRRTSRPTAASSWSMTSAASASRPSSCSTASSRRWSTTSTISR